MSTLEDRILEKFENDYGRTPSEHEERELYSERNKIDFIKGNNTITLDPGGDIYASLVSLAANGGGILYLQDGTYTLSADVSLQGRIQIVGIGQDSTILDLSNGHIIEANNAGVYTTG